MALDTDVRRVLAQGLGNDYIAKNIYDTIDAAAGGAAAAGSSGAIQKSDGAGGFADSGIVASAGSITTGAWNGTAVAVAKGGTGSTTASAARTALGLGPAVAVTGSKVSGVALVSLLAALVTLNLITDGTSA